MAEPNGKNVKNWIISSQAPKLVMIEHGEGSESRWLWVSNDGLTNLMRLKVYSDPIGNFRDCLDCYHNGHKINDGDEFAYAAGPRGRGGTSKFGSRSLPNYQSCKQQVDYRHLPGFDVGKLPVHAPGY